jgi:hypothetical protein
LVIGSSTAQTSSLEPEIQRVTTSPELPSRIDKLDEVSKRDQRLYERDAMGDAYQLSYVGTAVANYRRLAAESPGSVPPPRKVVRFDRAGWARLLAVAAADERSYFMRQAAAKRIVIEG